MELKDYLRTLRRRWISILLVGLVAGGLALGYSLITTKKYASSARLFISAPQGDSTAVLQGVQSSQQSVQSFANLVTSIDLAEQVLSATGVSMDPKALSGEVKASVVTQTVNLTITVTDSDPHRAQALAQGYAVALVDQVRILTTPPGQTRAPIKATIFDNASFSGSPISPKTTLNVALGAVLGLLLGLGLAVLREALDTRVRSADNLREIADKPILGVIAFDSHAKESPFLTDAPAHSPRAEAFRMLRTNLQFLDVDSTHKVFVLTSAVPEEGKTSTSVNLALSLAQAGVRTLLIEGDLRRPRAATRLGLDSAAGVTSVLVGKVEFKEAIQSHTDIGIDFLASGPVPPNPAELLQSRAMSDLLDLARGMYDVVLIDAPPLLPVTDAALIAAQADGAILIVRHGVTTRDQVRSSCERLEQVDAELAGLVLNMAPTRGDGSYGYGYGYGYSPDTVTA